MRPSAPRPNRRLVALAIFVVVVAMSGAGIRVSNGNTMPDPDGETNAEGSARIGALGAALSYPPSTLIKGLTWAPASAIVHRAHDSDNWPLTWGDDDHLYAAYGDGTGFPPKMPEKLSLGLARIEGGPDDFRGINIRSATAEQKGNGKNGLKASGLLMVDGTLYMWVRNACNSQLAWSKDHGQTWSWAPWKFTASFGCPSFLNFGRNYAGARDDSVYIYSHDSDSAYETADRVVLASVKKGRILDRDAYTFFKGLSPDGAPVWDRELNHRGGVFSQPGQCYRVSVSFHSGLKRYLLCQTGCDGPVQVGIGIYDAPEPWGPWTTVYRSDAWDVAPGESCSIPTKWIDGADQSIHFVFSGDDSFSVRKATLHIAGKAPPLR